jgi:hypothetical protein
LAEAGMRVSVDVESVSHQIEKKNTTRRIDIAKDHGIITMGFHLALIWRGS